MMSVLMYESTQGFQFTSARSLWPKYIPRILMWVFDQVYPCGAFIRPRLLPSHSPSHFLGCTFALEACSYWHKVIFSTSSDSSPKSIKVVSSAYWDSLNSVPSTLIPTICLFALMASAKISAATMYNIADSGHPCLVPLSRVKPSDSVTLTLILLDIWLCASLIHCMKLSPKFEFDESLVLNNEY